MDTAADGRPYRPAVGLVVVNSAGLVLAGRRRIKHDSGLNWQFPQGGIDGNDLRDAAWRELLEETGMTPDEAKLLAFLPETTCYDWPNPNHTGAFGGQRHSWAVFRKNTDNLPNLHKASDKEFDLVHWFAFADLIARAPYFRKAGYERVLRQLVDLHHQLRLQV